MFGLIVRLHERVVEMTKKINISYLLWFSIYFVVVFAVNPVFRSVMKYGNEEKLSAFCFYFFLCLSKKEDLKLYREKIIKNLSAFRLTFRLF